MSVTITEPVVSCEAVVMGTTAELMIIGGPGELLAQWAATRLTELETAWSRFLPESELCRLGEKAGAGPVPVSAETLEVIGRALSLWYVTRGGFDPTIRRALEHSGYDRTFRLVAPTGPAPAVSPVPAPGCEGIRIDRVHSTISLPAGVTLDLGGIGKGMAADLIATGLVERGAAGACVSLGGDVRVAGRGLDGGPWEIEVEDPFDSSQVLCRRTLVDSAIVTSTTRFRRWMRGDTLMHHIIDPATGAAADRGVTAVVAIGDAAWWAEGVAKAALVAGVADGLALLERLGVAAVMIDDRGDHHETSYWAQS